MRRKGRRIKYASAAIGVTLPLMLSAQAQAQDGCTKPLQLIAKLPMTKLGSRVTVPISLNGTTRQFLVDTGGVYPQVSTDVATELKLAKMESPMQLYGVSGQVSKYYTTAEIGLGGLKAPKMDLIISDMPGLDGIFPPVAFAAYDFDFDFAGNQLNMVSSDHCQGKVIYWNAQAAAVVPFKIDDSHRITVPVTVDGQPMIAVVDTGSAISAMSLEAARVKFALTPSSPDMTAVGHIGDDEKAVIYSHPFKTLSFEGITVSNPQIAILTDVVNKNADHTNETGSHIRMISDSLTLPQLIVGMDVLNKLHMYLAIKEKRLYLTEAGAPAGN
jgi:predicted aspartyl protease